MSFPIKVVGSFAGQNWLITPAARALDDAPPQDIHAQKWLLTLSGVAMADLKGDISDDWRRATLLLEPTVLDPMHYAIAHHSIPTPPGTEDHSYGLGFQVEQEAPYASISSVFNESKSGNSGFAVDAWRPNYYGIGVDAFSHQYTDKIFSGLKVDVAVRDTEAWLYRVGYNIALLGKIVFLAEQKTLFRSNFNTTVGEPPNSVQEVGTAHIDPSGKVTVANAPDQSSEKWVQIVGPKAQENAISALHCVLAESPGEGVYTFSAELFFKHLDSGIASIGFESGHQEFLHIDFLPATGKARIDDIGLEFGSFPIGAGFIVQVILTVRPPKTTVLVVLTGAAAGAQEASVQPEFQYLAPQFEAVKLWQGLQFAPRPGSKDGFSFDATNVSVTYVN